MAANFDGQLVLFDSEAFEAGVDAESCCPPDSGDRLVPIHSRCRSSRSEAYPPGARLEPANLGPVGGRKTLQGRFIRGVDLGQGRKGEGSLEEPGMGHDQVRLIDG